MYDQPPDIFHAASLEERHKVTLNIIIYQESLEISIYNIDNLQLFCRLNEDLFQPLGVRDCVSNGKIAFIILAYINFSR